MAAQIPPWLQPRGDPGAEYLSAFHAGAQIAQEQSRLKADAEKAAMAAAERAQVAQQDALQAQQKIEIENAYHQSQIGLRKQALDQAGQKIKMAAEGAARRFSAQQQIKQAIAGGMSPDEAYLKFGADAFTSMAGVAPLAKQMHERVNPFVPTANKELGITQVSPGHWIRSAPTGTTEAEPITEKGTGKQIPGYYSAGNRIIKATAPADRSLKVQDDILKQKSAAIGKRLQILDPDNPKEAAEKSVLQSQLSEIDKQRISLARGEAIHQSEKSAKRFKDKSGKVWVYTGDNPDPSKDADESHWQMK